MSLDELVNIYNQKLTSHGGGGGGGRSTIATDLSHNTPQSTFTMNTGFESLPESVINQGNFSFTNSATSALLFDNDTSRFQLNDRVLAGESVRPTSMNNRPRVDRVKHVDTLDFSSADDDIAAIENNPEYTTRYPDVKPQLNIINAREANIPPIDMFTNPGEQVQRLIHQGKLKNLHGYINYPYNYLEPPWHYSQTEEQQGYVNHNPPRTHFTAQEIEGGYAEDYQEISLPHGIPQEVVSQDRYEIIPLPKMVYENFVPLIATRRIVCRQSRPDRVSGEPNYPLPSSLMTSKLAQVDEMTYQI